MTGKLGSLVRASKSGVLLTNVDLKQIFTLCHIRGGL